MEQTPTMEREIPVTFATVELADKGQELARMVLRRTGLFDAKKAENAKRQGVIDELDEEIAEFAQSISDGFENRAQGDLFHDQALPPASATKRLAEIAAWSAKHPFAADAEKIDTCSVEGCGAQQGADVHVPPAPSAPHKFVGDGSGEDKCWGCGSGAGDPIHVEPSATPERDPNAPHAAEPGDQPEGEPKACLFCTRAVDDPIHHVEEILASATCEALAAVKVCSRCGKAQTSADVVLYDRDVKPVCDPCVRSAIEAATWPHPFALKDGVDVASKSSKCRHCKRRSDDAVHDVPPPQEAPAAATGDPAYDFDGTEHPPAVISSARAIEGTPETPDDGADDGNVGGEAGA